ncbi:type II secretion system protein [Nautilia sp. PV-1]|uniref:prepilin-type N-terminal cleavage/methylation domain-containing protein n=1 Tax=Nautilia sp. PV-1 TaxID=2579250 RepID=UPI000FDA5EE4|nr:prepilin-type N-terminal cleavage/methylation domain-containing protein [Nautilia sp. PV-1]AZV46521.1 type II secretion system protein [Nautilia sp. PV-1]
MKNLKISKGFTLFEVLVSIIILGIVMTTFPFIFQTMTGANKQVMKEEVFFQEFTVLSLINARYFDENNTVGDNFYKDLNATGGDSELLNNHSSLYAGKTSRVAKAEFNNNILRSGTNYTTSAIGLDPGENASDLSTYDDVDDFNGYHENFLNYVINVNVKYISDNADYSAQDMNFSFNYSAPASNTNIKLITVWCKVGDTNITLRYPTSNIGASKFLSLEEISR